MTRRLALVALLIGLLVSLPAAAQLQYFGYVGGANDDWALNQTKGFTNFAHISAPDSVTNSFVKDRVTAMSQRGIKAVIDLGRVLWCDYDSSGRYLFICSDWQQRWTAWKVYNASILTADKVLALSIRDEPFNYNLNMQDFEQAAAVVKADLPWAKLYLVEAACVVARDDCGHHAGFNAVGRYQGTLPNIDWIGLDDYGIYPKTDATFQEARNVFRSKFPGKKWLYTMDGYWDPDLHGIRLEGLGINEMQKIARDWYDVASADPNAVLLGVPFWYASFPVLGSQDFPCSVLSEHVLIGRAITGKVRAQTALPVGQLESIAHGTGIATGWACDPDGTLCENPQVDLLKNGIYLTTALWPSSWTVRPEYLLKPQCGTGTAYRFQVSLASSSSSYPIVATAKDLDSASTTGLPSDCPENPACIWYTKWFDPKGYMQAISPSGIAAGWVCDPDAPQVSSKVRLALSDGTQIGVFTTNLGSEQAVADECRGGYLHRFSVQLPAWAYGRSVYAWALDLVPTKQIRIPWLCEPGWSCIWN